MKKNGVIIVLILLVAILLRFYRFFDIPYTLDELSALNRTFYSSFSELIEKGVYNDGHPALIQIFLFYWVHWFSYNEWIVKLPFLLMGIASIYLIYRIGKEWFSETVGIIASTWMTTLQFTIMYSQIARPYASGLFFVLGMTFFWTQWLKKIQQNGLFHGLILFSPFLVHIIIIFHYYKQF
ncbi:MAG: glycosyltransferase family 39 protein [Bacteroidales bacterium]|nr:glycosyltransferase family 39 protein [Bacteroidales bacterium]